MNIVGLYMGVGGGRGGGGTCVENECLVEFLFSTSKRQAGQCWDCCFR